MIVNERPQPLPAARRPTTASRSTLRRTGRVRVDGRPSRCRATRSAPGASSAPTQLPPDVRATRTYLFDGGCVTYDFDFDDTADASLLVELDSALAFQPRDELVDRGRATRPASACAAPARHRASDGDRDRRCWLHRRSAVLLRLVAIALAVVTTLLSLRLLGGRRGWVTALRRRR